MTLLRVEGEVGHINGAGAFGDGGLVPHDLAIITKNHVGLHGAGELVIGTVADSEKGSCDAWEPWEDTLTTFISGIHTAVVVWKDFRNDKADTHAQNDAV